VKVDIFEKFKNYSMKKLLLIVSFILSQNCFSQSSTIFTDDIDRFWMAYDSIVKLNNTQQQVEVLQKMYIDKGSVGLKAFMEERPFKTEDLVKIINGFPKFWASIRPRTAIVNSKIPEMERSIGYLKKLYPELKEGAMYFTIGALQSGGTRQGNKVLIGSEIAMGDKTVDVSEFGNNWLKEVFAFADDDRLVALNVHEYIHTQQNLNDQKMSLLGKAMAEGSCDFIAELATQKPYVANYLNYYSQHEVETWELFNSQKEGKASSQWLSTGSNPNLPCSDIGYAIGYTISKFYYQNSKNKPVAIKNIIEGKWDDFGFCIAFLKDSGYLQQLKKKGYRESLYSKIEGYSIENGHMKFIFKRQANIVSFGNNGMEVFNHVNFEKIKTVNVAGDFNGWNKDAEAYKMKRVSADVFELELPISEVLKKGERKYFKFVINGQNWVEPQFKTTNKGSADGGSTNLFVEI
jgi:hypothetical protein